MLSMLLKRFSYFENWVLDKLDQEELKIYRKLLAKEKNKTRMDTVVKKELYFPQILYPQMNMPVEWWYFTGHLQSKKQRWGYQFCFFKFHPQVLRVGVIPLTKVRKEPFLVLHFALTDKNKNKFDYWQQAGFTEPQIIRYDKLCLRLKSSSLGFSDKFVIRVKSKIGNLSMEMFPKTEIVKQFSSGYSEMYPGHRTYYVSYPRLSSRGKLTIGDKKYSVSGNSWFDHQKMSMRHHSSLKGWDWFSIMFEDKTELMFFVLRNNKGFIRNHLGGTYIDKKGKIVNLRQENSEIETTSHWKSPHTGILYPSGWRMKIKRLELDVDIIPEVKDQELHTRTFIPTAYWEGACSVKGTKKGRKITGQSYVELTGYDKRLSTKLLYTFMD